MSSRYVALLRGVNVGGNNKIPMAALREALEGAGFTDVLTYIASGNVLFTSDRPVDSLAQSIRNIITERFGHQVDILVLSAAKMQAIAAAIPDDWVNDENTRCDVLYLWPSADRPDFVDELPIRDGIDHVRYVPGALLWSMSRRDVTRSGLGRLAGTPPLYKQLTIRNCNTARKLATLV